MTLSLVEEIEQLQNCRTHQDCARWLLTCPLSKLMTYEMTIKTRLRERGFLVGVEYLDHQLRMLRAPCRDGHMLLPPEGDNVNTVWDLVLDIARGTLVEDNQPFPPVGGEGEAI